jgi:hypothetical protein
LGERALDGGGEFGPPAGDLALWNPTLTFEPGTTILVEPGEALVIGNHHSYYSLVADGSAGTIVFDGVSAEPGSWSGLDFDGFGASSRLIHCRIAHGGSPRDDGLTGNILARYSTPVIRDCEITGSAGWGIWLPDEPDVDPDSLEALNRFEGNAAGNVRRPRGGGLQSTSGLSRRSAPPADQ